MFIGVYLLGCGFVYLLSLLVARQARAHWKRILGWSMVSTMVCLLLFIFLSTQLGILTLGESSSYSIPADYVALGLTGILTLGVALVGMLSPALITISIR